MLLLAGESTGLTESANGIAQFLTVVFLFLFVLAITFFTTRWMGNYQKSKSLGANIEVVETCRISVNKYVQIIRIGEKYFAVGSGKEEVTFLCELEEKDIHLPEAVPVSVMKFGDLLEKIKKGMK